MRVRASISRWMIGSRRNCITPIQEQRRKCPTPPRTRRSVARGPGFFAFRSPAQAPSPCYCGFATSHRKAYLKYLLSPASTTPVRTRPSLLRLVQTQARPELFHLSVIAYIQATGADPAFAAPAPATVDAFVSHLRANGVHATRRRQADTDD